MKPCLLIAAGGTGGHIFPALAVADILRTQGWRVEWLGSRGGMEERLVPLNNIELHVLPISGWRGKGFLSLLTAPISLWRSVRQARQLINKLNVTVVLGMGGFASGPGGVAARLCGVPLLIHEQNAVAGLTNRILAKIAARVLTAFPKVLANAEVVGNPVRADLLFLAVPEQRLAGRTDRLHLLIIGGSRGAKVFNDTLAPALALLDEKSRPTIWHQVGRGQLTPTENVYRRADLTIDDSSIRVVEFIDDMQSAYGWADLVLCRAGALTVSEMAAVGLAGIYVPYALAVDDHQTRNAEYLCEKNAGWLVSQTQFNAQSLADLLAKAVADRGDLLRMATRAREAATSDSAQRVAGHITELAGPRA